MQDELYYLFTDGASRSNPGPSGWGAILIQGSKVLELGASQSKATNNQMELKAVIHSLEEAYRAPAPINIYTDSKYLIQGISEWIPRWKANGWKTTSGAAVANQELWQKLDILVTLFKKQVPLILFMSLLMWVWN